MTPSVCVIYTGGTIGMLPAVDGYRPAHGLRERIVAEIPRLSGADMPLIEFVDFDQLIDSANAHPSHWNTIAEMIIERYDRYVGFVVLQSADDLELVFHVFQGTQRRRKFPFFAFALRHPFIHDGAVRGVDKPHPERAFGSFFSRTEAGGKRAFQRRQRNGRADAAEKLPALDGR